jgi:hypothetical protein
MTTEDALENIEIGGFAEWLPLPLDGAPSAVDEMVDHFADDPAGPTTIRAMATQLAELGRQLGASSDDDSLMIGAWSLLPPGGRRLELRALVTMTCQRVAEGATPGEVVEQMCSEVDLHQPPDVEEIETASGPGHMVRLRHVVSQSGGVDVSEMVLCFWLPETLPGVAVVLSSMLIPDLVVAAEVAGYLRPLAASVAGL